MSRKIKKASKFSAKLFGTIAFAILFAFNIQIAFGNNTNDGINIFGQKITFFNDLAAKRVGIFGDDDGETGNGGGGGGTDNGNGPNDHYAMAYLYYYDCGTIFNHVYCACTDLRCLYGGSVCFPYNDCGN